ncbi:MAG TPA: MFS transporter [Aggregatilineaceae bacterium]|nr:MFS transporter [Aggregatilineaceae bacterium]
MERLPLPASIVRPLGYPHVNTLPERQQDGLRSFWLDGLFSSLASGFTDPYYTLYMLSLRANNAQIGLVNTLTQLAGAAFAMPGAAIADRTGRYKRMALLAGLVSRLMWLVMLIVPWLLSGDAAVWTVLVAWVAIAGMGALGNAAWTALSAELVPARLRGGYFASRNIIMQLAQLLAIPVAGQLVNAIGEPGGYQVNFGLAFVAGTVSLYFYNRLPEHPPGPQTDRLRTREVLRRITQMPTFIRFVVAHAILMLGVMIGGPFINVYMAEKAGFSVGTIGLVTTVGVLAGLVGMRLMGRVHDRFGIIRTMQFGLGVPLIPVAWLWVHHPWQGYLVSSLSSLTWAGYNLGAFNLLLASTPDEHRPRYIAIYTTIVSMVGAIGPLMGGGLLDAVGFSPVFSLSCIVRALGLILFFALVREPDHAPEPEYVA